MVNWFCLQVHVSMHGQEALFSENMPLKEVIKHLKEQQATPMPKQNNLKTHLQRPQDMFMETGEFESRTEEGCCVGIPSGTQFHRLSYFHRK